VTYGLAPVELVRSSRQSVFHGVDNRPLGAVLINRFHDAMKMLVEGFELA
jgi:hypothetical protein